MAALSVFDIFKIGVGPSSSHTLGPWRAAEAFLARCRELGIWENVAGIRVDLYGSLAKTGKGHGTDVAVLLGLEGWDPETCDTTAIPTRIEAISESRCLVLGATRQIPFDPATDVRFHFRESLPFHPNGLIFTAILSNGDSLAESYYSVGGGFVVQEGQDDEDERSPIRLPHPIDSASELLTYTEEHDVTIPEIVWQNELSWRSPEEIRAGVGRLWSTMVDCLYRGCHTDGILPGGLNVVRRAASMNRKLLDDRAFDNPEEWIEAIRESHPMFNTVLKWVGCFALAVNEENAAFGRVVTAPTNGAAGVIPAVLMYYRCFYESDMGGIERFLLTAGELGSLFKKGATISAAMGGCQAEIGVSSAMAAGGLCQVLGGSSEQVLMAAEIAMEHHLGMTCDPVGGLVQIPCIERNTMGAVKAIMAAQLALEGDPAHAKVSLDAVIRSMWETALDMNSKYKETAEGGLALQIPVNVPEC